MTPRRMTPADQRQVKTDTFDIYAIKRWWGVSVDREPAERAAERDGPLSASLTPTQSLNNLEG